MVLVLKWRAHFGDLKARRREPFGRTLEHEIELSSSEHEQFHRVPQHNGRDDVDEGIEDEETEGRKLSR